MARLRTRLSRLEEAIPEPRQRSWAAELAPYLVGYELERMHGIVVRAVEQGGWPTHEQDITDFEHLTNLALERRDAGWQLDRIDQHREELTQAHRARGWAMWQLIFSLRRRHPSSLFTPLSDAGYCDLLDIEADEIIDLAKLVQRASTCEDLAEYADVIRRLRIDGTPTSQREFQGLVFEGLLPARDDPLC